MLSCYVVRKKQKQKKAHYWKHYIILKIVMLSKITGWARQSLSFYNSAVLDQVFRYFTQGKY